MGMLAKVAEAITDHEATIERLARERHDADERLVEALLPARAHLTWQQIADRLGTSRQAAQQRLGKYSSRQTS